MADELIGEGIAREALFAKLARNVERRIDAAKDAVIAAQTPNERAAAERELQLAKEEVNWI